MKIGVIGSAERNLVVEIDDTAAVAVSVQEGPVKGLPEAFSPTSAVDRAKGALRDLQKLIADAADTVAESVGQMAEPPTKVAVEFGVKFAGEGGIPTVTKLSTEAAMKVTIEWSRSA